jgi:propanol-preferring alcohol dehydrogenase
MKAMLLGQIGDFKPGEARLKLEKVPIPSPAEGELLVRVSACGVCHTELDEIEGRTPPPHLPMILGHQIVGRVDARSRTKRFQTGLRVGIGWIYSACGRCRYCQEGNENLCLDFKATGRDVNGGYADYIIVPDTSAYPIPQTFLDSQAAPLLCAGAIGYRSLKLAEMEDGQTLGLVGFGASAHLVLQLARYRFPQSPIFIFSRNKAEQDFARELGANWAGAIEAKPPHKLDRIIDTTPVWSTVVEALDNLAPGGRLVINAIRKDDVDKSSLLRFDYPRHLWMEKEIKSVANVARADINEFLDIAAAIKIRPSVQEFAFEDANRALAEMKTGKIRGAKVLVNR